MGDKRGNDEESGVFEQDEAKKVNKFFNLIFIDIFVGVHRQNEHRRTANGHRPGALSVQQCKSSYAGIV